MLVRLVCCALAVFAILAAMPGLPTSTSSSDSGTIHTGVGSEAEASEFPCNGDSGPVVCVPDRGEGWRLSSDASGDCTDSLAGWYGDCVFAFDAGDHLRIWGTRGIPMRSFVITWIPPDDGGSSDAPDQQDPAEPAPARAETGTAPAPAPTSPESVVAQRDPTTSSDEAAVAAPEEPTPVPPAVPHAEPEAALDQLWEPPVRDLPKYDDLVAAPQPTFPAAAGWTGRRDAGAPAAAGVAALLAAGWALRLRRSQDEREGPATS